MDVKAAFLGFRVTVTLITLSDVSWESQFLWLHCQGFLKAEHIWMKQFYRSNIHSWAWCIFGELFNVSCVRYLSDTRTCLASGLLHEEALLQQKDCDPGMWAQNFFSMWGQNYLGLNLTLVYFTQKNERWWTAEKRKIFYFDLCKLL